MRNCLSVGTTVVAGATFLLTACGDSSAPGEPVGVYLLETANGRTLPFEQLDYNPVFVLRRGDLVLRRDGTYTLMLDGLYELLENTYAISGTTLTLSVGSPRQLDPIVAVIGGDSARFSFFANTFVPPNFDFVFRRSTTPDVPIREGTYILTAVNGRGAPFVAGDTTIDGIRYVGRVAFDTITFSDGVVFKESRQDSETTYRASADSTMWVSGGRSYGSYSGRDGWVMLRRYYQEGVSETRSDSFAVGNGTLTRVRRLRDQTVQEQYSRLR